MGEEVRGRRGDEEKGRNGEGVKGWLNCRWLQANGKRSPAFPWTLVQRVWAKAHVEDNDSQTVG